MSVVALLLDVVCTFNEIFWLYQWVNIFLEKKDFLKNKYGYGHRVEWLLYGVYTITVFCFNRITLTSAYTMVVIMIINFIAVLCLWKSDIMQTFAVEGGYFFALFLLGNITISMTGMIGGERLIQACTGETGMPRVIYLLVNGSLWYMLNKHSTFYIKKKGVWSKGFKYIACVSIVGVIGSAFIGMMLVESFSIHINIAWYVFIGIILVCVFGSYFIIKQKDIRLQMTILAAKNEMLEKNYMQVNEFYLTNAKLYHDMNHHFDAIYHLIREGNQEQAKKYIETLRTPDYYAEITRQSGLNFLDAVFHEIDKKAKKKGVLFTVEIPLLPCDIGIENRDICSLFANLLENAMEASNEEIHVNVKHVNKNLFITIKNDYSVVPVKKDGRFMTLKKEKNLHGWGTQIVEQIVKKYDGTIEYNMDNGYFTAYVVLSEHIKENKNNE